MKTFIVLLIFLGSIMMLQVIKPGSSGDMLKADTSYVNPNGTSELAALMREMQVYSNKAREDVNSGIAPASYPVSFDKIHTAKITDRMSKSDFYTQFADLYIMAVKNYAASTPELRIEAYNNMVSACLACHSQHCPGPVPVIKKMLIPTGK